MTSSTSVYSLTNTIVTEDDHITPETNRQKTLLKTEHYLHNISWCNTTICRLSGLVGPNREIGKFLHQKKNIPGANSPVNLVHITDVVSIITSLIQQEIWNETFNIVADKHPTKKECYSKASSKCGLKTPEFNQEKNINYKIVSNEKIKKWLNYPFKKPDPMLFI